MRVLNRAFDHPMELEERAADPLAGGLMRGYQCGMVWGAALAAGAQAYRLFGTGPQAESMAIIASQRITESFRAQNKSINCREITGIDVSAPTTGAVARFLVKSAPTGSCFGMAARYAHRAFKAINSALAQKPVAAPVAPVSCTTLLAQKMGASDGQTVMAAGWAGGIGLSGGACGALGTALWISGIDSLKKGDSKIGLQAPGVLDAIEKFSKCTNGEFECSKITGRKFESVDDHARYVCAGNCSMMIEVLAAQGRIPL